jgi:threonine/homoserine/homoserine lactone efflux protein
LSCPTLVTGIVAAGTTGSLALVAVVVLRHDRQAAWLLLVVAGTLFLAYRAYASLREQHERLRRFARVVADAIVAPAARRRRGLRVPCWSPTASASWAPSTPTT